jgi:hypothetical protein
MTTCSCCGEVVLDSFENCRAMFNAVLEREYSEPDFGEAHLFTVDYGLHGRNGFLQSE